MDAWRTTINQYAPLIAAEARVVRILLACTGLGALFVIAKVASDYSKDRAQYGFFQSKSAMLVELLQDAQHSLLSFV